MVSRGRVVDLCASCLPNLGLQRTINRRDVSSSGAHQLLLTTARVRPEGPHAVSAGAVARR
jgi:hypothetical protein